MHKCSTLGAALVTTVAAGPAMAGDLSATTEFPVGGRYEIYNRFHVEQLVPEMHDSLTTVSVTLTVDVRAIDIVDGAPTLRMRFESLKMDFEQHASGFYSLLQFDSQAEDPAFNDDTIELESLIGETVEFSFDPELQADDLLVVLKTSFPDRNAGRMFRVFLSESLVSQSLKWIFSLSPDADAADLGDTFQGAVYGRLASELMIDYITSIAYDSLDGDLAHLSMTGSAGVQDARTVGSQLDGDTLFAPAAQSLSGTAIWNTTDHVLESLNLSADMLLQPDEIDPLGKRIQQRRHALEFRIRRLHDPA